MRTPTKARLTHRLFHWWSFLLFIYILRQHIMKVGRREITWEQEVGSPSVSTDGLGLSSSAQTPQRGHGPGQTRTLCQKEKSFHGFFFPALPHEHLPSPVQYPAEVTTPKNNCTSQNHKVGRDFQDHQVQSNPNLN